MKRFFDSHPEVFDRLHDAVIVTDLEGNVIDCNEACRSIYGYSREEFQGRSVGLLYPPSQLSKMAGLIESVKRQGRADGEFLNVTKDGREIYIQLSVTLLCHDDGAPYGMIGVSLDVTAYRMAERARYEADEVNRAARAAAGVGTWWLDLRNGEAHWDEQTNVLLGLPEGCKQSRETFYSRIHPDDRRHVDSLLGRPMPDNSEYIAEYRVPQEDGSCRYLLARGRTVYSDGTPERMLGVVTDITARKNTEKELHTAEARYRAFFDSPILGVLTVNLERTLDVNESFCNLVGYRREELLSGSIRWQDITPGDYLERDYVAIQELMEKGTAVPYEKEYVRNDNSRVRVMHGAVLISREPLEWSCFVLDVTAHHRALGALRAGDMMAAAARLGSSLAHEINNPLASLTNIVYLLRYSKNGAGNTDLLTAAQEALERVTRITRQMIGIYSERELAAAFNIGDVLEDTLASYAARTRSKNIRVTKRNELRHERFIGVEPEFRRMLSALLENAVEHARPGGAVNVRLYPSRDWSDGGRSGVRVLVSDNGPGIPKAQVANLFEPFQSTKALKGSGLGLWMCRGIAEKHGGSVRVRSSTRDGMTGTAISVFLPASGQFAA
jgi:PAS domain S-box-containing protein